MLRSSWPAALLVLACAPSPREQAPPTPAPPEAPSSRPAERASEPEAPVQRMAPPEVAYAHGWMPVASTGADRFVGEHPTYDGRGVLIAILDTGVDPAVPGLVTTSTGEPKVADVRDFSDEGVVSLAPVAPRGDTVIVAGRTLAGFGRVRALNTSGPYYAGVLEEPVLGAPPASDLNADGDAVDSLPLIVVKATDGWVVLADTDGDRSLAGERPVRDYLTGRESFGWAPRGHTPPVNVAANLDEEGGRPTLHLILALDAHGTHVAGVAAGNDLYGVSGFDGVAPGAQLLALKISNRANGSVSGRGSILAAMDYAIRFAARRRQPLVINLSFGVGNEREGEARIDRLIDSVLAKHPALPLVVAAGNDGPGLSTVGIPGSASRAISVGGTVPASFLPPSHAPSAEIVADFSARGGEVAKPDLVGPGVAYSSVPRWDAGEEVKQGTSMAAPHVAGLVGLLLSAMAQEKRAVDAGSLRQALMVTARPARRSHYLDEGRGLPDIDAAYRWLSEGRRAPVIEVSVPGSRATAAWRVAEPGGDRAGTVTFEVSRASESPAASYTLRSDVPWLTAPGSITISGERAKVQLHYAGSRLAAPGAYTGMVAGWPADTLAGPAFRLVTTVVVPATVADTALMLRRDVPVVAGEVLRSFFRSDSGRPFLVKVSGVAGQQGIAYLHEPGGAPFREGSMRPVGSGGQAATYRVDARDVVPGAYQAAVAPMPGGRLAAGVTVQHAPITLTSRAEGDFAVGELVNVSAREVTIEAELRLRGGQREDTVRGRGSGIRAVPFEIPAWATGLEVDIGMDREQWERFTDFGVTVLDSLGRQLAQDPLEYSFGRLSTVLPEKRGPVRPSLSLYPGFADAGDTREWSVVARIRLYADSAVAVEAEGTGELRLPPRARGVARFRLPEPPWPLPEGFSPLGVILVREGEEVWTRESGFSRSGR